MTIVSLHYSKPVVNFVSMTIDDVFQCLANNGYIHSVDEMIDTKQYGFKYIGFDKGYHRFLMIFKDNHNDELFYVTRVLVTLDDKGYLIGDYTGCPEYEGSYNACKEYFNNLNYTQE